MLVDHQVAYFTSASGRFGVGVGMGIGTSVGVAIGNLVGEASGVDPAGVESTR